MNVLIAITAWVYQATAAWFIAGLVGGLLILVIERLTRRPDPSDAEVRRAAGRYREIYGDDASAVIGDHRLAARFAPDGRHGRFLERVAAELQAGAVTARDRQKAIEP